MAFKNTALPVITPLHAGTRGQIEVFRVLKIFGHRFDWQEGQHGPKGGLLIETLSGQKAFYVVSPKFLSYKTKSLEGGLLQERLDEFYTSLMWPNQHENHDIRLNEDMVYAAVTKNEGLPEVTIEGVSYPHFFIQDYFKTFSRGPKEKVKRDTLGKSRFIEPGDQVITGYARIVRDPENKFTLSSGGIVHVEMVSDPINFVDFAAVEKYLFRQVSGSNMNGCAIALHVVDDAGKSLKSANYFPPRVDKGKTVAGTPQSEIMEDIQELKDSGVQAKQLRVFETTRAFLDNNSFMTDEGRGIKEIRRILQYVYQYNPTEVKVAVNVVAKPSRGGGRPKKKGAPSHMVRMAMSRTVFLDKKEGINASRPGKIRTLVPYAEGDAILSYQSYMTPEARGQVVLPNTPQVDTSLETLEQDAQEILETPERDMSFASPSPLPENT